jgi:hypothetical protein
VNILTMQSRTAGKPAGGSRPAWNLGEGLTSPRRIKQVFMKCYTGPRAVCGEKRDEPSDCIKGGEYLN